MVAAGVPLARRTYTGVIPGRGEVITVAAKARKIGRDAKTGLFIPVSAAQRRKSTATVETIKPRRGKYSRASGKRPAVGAGTGHMQEDAPSPYPPLRAV